MAITFQKRQKEMKRLEKQRAKAERRAQKKLANRDGVAPEQDTNETEYPELETPPGTPGIEFEPQN